MLHVPAPDPLYDNEIAPATGTGFTAVDIAAATTLASSSSSSPAYAPPSLPTSVYGATSTAPTVAADGVQRPRFDHMTTDVRKLEALLSGLREHTGVSALSMLMPMPHPMVSTPSSLGSGSSSSHKNASAPDIGGGIVGGSIIAGGGGIAGGSIITGGGGEGMNRSGIMNTPLDAMSDAPLPSSLPTNGWSFAQLRSALSTANPSAHAAASEHTPAAGMPSAAASSSTSTLTLMETGAGGAMLRYSPAVSQLPQLSSRMRGYV